MYKYLDISTYISHQDTIQVKNAAYIYLIIYHLSISLYTLYSISAAISALIY